MGWARGVYILPPGSIRECVGLFYHSGQPQDANALQERPICSKFCVPEDLMRGSEEPGKRVALVGWGMRGWPPYFHSSLRPPTAAIFIGSD